MENNQLSTDIHELQRKVRDLFAEIAFKHDDFIFTGQVEQVDQSHNFTGKVVFKHNVQINCITR